MSKMFTCSLEKAIDIQAEKYYNKCEENKNSIQKEEPKLIKPIEVTNKSTNYFNINVTINF